MIDQKAFEWLNENQLSYDIWDKKYRYNNRICTNYSASNYNRLFMGKSGKSQNARIQKKKKIAI